MNNETKMAQIAVNKSLLKEYTNTSGERIVYLDNGKEFQIQIYNPTSQTIAAEIYINGDRIPNKIVLRPAERIWLDRYLDKARKFKFNTYEVDGDVETQELIKNNGEVKVKFYREIQAVTITPTYITTIVDSNNYNWNNPKYYTTTSNSINAIKTNINYASTSLTDCCAKEYNKEYLNISNNDIKTICSGTLLADDTTICKTAATSTIKYENDDTIETGRIDAGSYSSQKFENVSKDFSDWSFHTDIIKILPTSRKPVGASDLQKTYCPECGHKLKNTYKFCPYCGEHLDIE